MGDIQKFYKRCDYVTLELVNKMESILEKSRVDFKMKMRKILIMNAKLEVPKHLVHFRTLTTRVARQTSFVTNLTEAYY